MPRISPGSVYRRTRDGCWYIQFSIDGELKRESSGTKNHDEAIEFLQRRLDEAAHGRYTDHDRRPTLEDLHAMLLENYEFRRNRTNPSRHVRRLIEFFGNVKAEIIDEARIRQYSLKRLKADGMTPATLRRELALLKRMLRLGAGRLPRVPLVDLPRVDNARQGFFEEDEVRRILRHMAPHARELVEFLYLTGWRSSEAFRLRWTDINWRRRLRNFWEIRVIQEVQKCRPTAEFGAWRAWPQRAASPILPRHDENSPHDLGRRCARHRR